MIKNYKNNSLVLRDIFIILRLQITRPESVHPKKKKKKIIPQKPQRSVFEKRANNLPSDSGGERLESLEGLRSAQEAPFEFLSRLAFLRSLSREKNISYIFQDPPPLFETTPRPKYEIDEAKYIKINK